MRRLSGRLDHEGKSALSRLVESQWVEDVDFNLEGCRELFEREKDTVDKDSQATLLELLEGGSEYEEWNIFSSQ